MAIGVESILLAQPPFPVRVHACTYVCALLLEIKPGLHVSSASALTLSPTPPAYL